MIKTLSLVV